LRPAGLKRLLRIEKYNNYKLSLSAEAKLKKFTLPSHGFAITFYIPVPQSWSKKKKKLHHGMLHQSTPDLDNLLKAMKDSLTSEDKYVAQYTACKRWVDFPDGWIEIQMDDTPCQVTIQPPVKE
jgi:Holliday junction resolvase RusA-like endonuclease